MYTEEFIDVPNETIVETIKKDGYFSFEHALTSQNVEMLLQEIDFDQILVNANDVGVVLSNTQKFLTHCLAKSKKTYDIITSTKILDICKKYFANSFMLLNHRVYQTRRSHHMPWHTDNNLQIGHNLIGKHDLPGLLFLFYLSDVTKNAFQYVKTSHEWSSMYSKENYLNDDTINSEYGKNIVRFPMQKGSLIICNTHGIHRAEPFCDRNYVRTTLLFQVDEIGDEKQSGVHGEENLINTDYIDNPSREVMEYLGFGCKRDYPAFPNSSVASMTVGEIMALQKKLLFLLLKALPKKIILSLLPSKAVVSAKRLVWHIKHRHP